MLYTVLLYLLSLFLFFIFFKFVVKIPPPKQATSQKDNSTQYHSFWQKKMQYEEDNLSNSEQR